MAMHQSRLAFNGGELSEYLIYRTDFAKHAGGAARMRNFLPLPFGAAAKRPGTRWLGTLAGTGMNSRAFAFTASDGTGYVLHFTPGLLSVYRKDGTLAASLPFLVGREWGEFTWSDSIRAVQMTALNDVAIFTHPAFHPMRLSTRGDTEWVMEWMPFEKPPVLDENLDETLEITVVSNPQADDWETDTHYHIGAVVMAEFEWVCTTAHTSSGANAPGKGSVWGRKFYQKGDPVKILGNNPTQLEWADFHDEPAGVWSLATGGVWAAGTDWNGLSGGQAITNWVNQTNPDNEETGGVVDYVIGDKVVCFTGEGWYGLVPHEPGVSNVGVFRCIVAHNTERFTYPWDLRGIYPAATSDPQAQGMWDSYLDSGAGGGSAYLWEFVRWTPFLVDGLFEYSGSVNYAVGDRVNHGGSCYLCTAGHASEADNEPGAGAHWASYWQLVTYAEGTVVTRGGTAYRAKSTHSPAAATEPGVGGSWASVWELAQYLEDTVVLHNGLAYKAKDTHNPAASNEPGKGLLAYLHWLDISILAGDKVQNGGRYFVAVATHGATADNEPGVGASWTTVWREISLMVPGFASSVFSAGSYWKISPERAVNDFQVTLDAQAYNDGAATNSIGVYGGWNVTSFGTWTGTFALERSADGGETWEVIFTWVSNGDRNVATSGTEDQPCLMRLRYLDDPERGNFPGRAVLIPETNFVTGYVLADVYVDAQTMTGHALGPMISGKTWHWAEGAFSAKYGFPRALTMHERRMIFGGTTANPVSLWFSKVEDFLDFEPGTDDDRGIFVTLATGNQHSIRWLSSARRLIMGSALGEWAAGSETQDMPMTASNLLIRQYSPKGSCHHQPLPAPNGLLILGRNGSRLYELAATPDSSGFITADLSRLAEHLTAGGISNFAFQTTREPCLWCVTRAGDLLSFHYSRDDQIAAWAKHTTSGGLFRDVVVFPSDSGDDEVFFVVSRGGVNQLERFPQAWQASQEAGEAGTYVDAAVTLAAAPWTVPSHLAGEAVAGLADGAAFSQTAAGGSLAFDDPPAAVVVGFPVASELKFLPMDMEVQGGTSMSRFKRCHEMIIAVYQSAGGGIVYDGEYQDFQYEAAADTLASEWLHLTVNPAHMVDLQPSITHAAPFPFTVRAAVVNWALHEP